MESQKNIADQIQKLEQELAALDSKRLDLKNKISQLRSPHKFDSEIINQKASIKNITVTDESSETIKIALFRSLFRGREDVYPRRFESKRSGKSGYQPVCRNEWIQPICRKPKVKCGECDNRDFEPVTDEVIRNHLIGKDPKDRYQREFVIGVYPIHELYESLTNNTKRNQMIIDDVLDAVSKNRFPVILTERKRHLEILKNLLDSRVQNVIVMKGGMGKKQRKAAMTALEQLTDNEEKVVLATGRYLGEGFDEDRLDTLFLTLPISWKGTITQYAGRLHRINDMKKEVLIFDYADLEVPMLLRMYERRLAGYRSIGYEIID